MLKDYTDINLLVDRSGSMASLHNDVIGGLNGFIEEQKKLPGKVTVNAYEFDNTCDVVVENTNINELQPFTKEHFVPRGGTNLYDAMARTINNRGKYFKSLKEEDRPEKVIFVIFTDGHHNINGEFGQKQVFDMVRHQEEKYSWEVIYLGANQNAMAVGAGFGIGAGKSMNFAPTSAGIMGAVKCASTYTSNYRNGKAGF